MTLEISPIVRKSLVLCVRLSGRDYQSTGTWGAES